MTTDNQQSPVYVVQFGEKSSIEDTEWVLKKLTQSKEDGGAGLTVTSSPPSSGKVMNYAGHSQDLNKTITRVHFGEPVQFNLFVELNGFAKMYPKFQVVLALNSSSNRLLLVLYFST